MRFGGTFCLHLQAKKKIVLQLFFFLPDVGRAILKLRKTFATLYEVTLQETINSLSRFLLVEKHLYTIALSIVIRNTITYRQVTDKFRASAVVVIIKIPQISIG